MELKNNSIIAVMIAVVTLPAAISVVAYLITKNPALRPLARTLHDEEIYKGQIVAVEIIAHVRWSTGRLKTFSQADLSDAIWRGFNAHGVRVRTMFENVKTDDPVSITYQVGSNRLGPYQIQRAGDAVNSAIAVYRMYQMY